MARRLRPAMTASEDAGEKRTKDRKHRERMETCRCLSFGCSGGFDCVWIPKRRFGICEAPAAMERLRAPSARLCVLPFSKMDAMRRKSKQREGKGFSAISQGAPEKLLFEDAHGFSRRKNGRKHSNTVVLRGFLPVLRPKRHRADSNSEIFRSA